MAVYYTQVKATSTALLGLGNNLREYSFQITTHL